MRVVQLLAGKPPQTIFDLIRSTGLTRTAITEQLNDLVALGFVERTSQRVAGRGRPRHQFSLTRAALMLLFASNQRLLVPAIWGAISEVAGLNCPPRSRPRQFDPGQTLPAEDQRQDAQGAAQAVGQAPPRRGGPAAR